MFENAACPGVSIKVIGSPVEAVTVNAPIDWVIAPYSCPARSEARRASSSVVLP